MSFKINEPKSWTLAQLPDPATFAVEAAVERMDAVDNTLASLGVDTPIPEMKSASADIRSAIPLAMTVLKGAARRYQSGLAANGNASRSAAAAVPTTGFKSVEERNLVVAAAALDPFQSFWKKTVQDEVDARAEKADALAKAATDSMLAAQKAIERATAKWKGPLALRVGADPARYQRITMFQKEEAEFLPSAVLQHLELAIDGGDVEIEDDFTLAAEMLCNDWSRLSTTDLGKQLRLPIEMTNRNSGTVAKERDAISAIRRRIAKRREERTPMPLLIAPQVYAQLVGAYSLIFGYYAALLPRGEYERHWLGPDMPDPLAIYPTWLCRMLPANPPADSLPR